MNKSLECKSCKEIICHLVSISRIIMKKKEDTYENKWWIQLIYWANVSSFSLFSLLFFCSSERYSFIKTLPVLTCHCYHVPPRPSLLWPVKIMVNLSPVSRSLLHSSPTAPILAMESQLPIMHACNYVAKNDYFSISWGNFDPTTQIWDFEAASTT